MSLWRHPCRPEKTPANVDKKWLSDELKSRGVSHDRLNPPLSEEEMKRILQRDFGFFSKPSLATAEQASATG